MSEQSTNPKDLIGAAKPQLHLIPPAAEILEAIVFELGAKKYGPYNWRSTKVSATVYLSAIRRHYAAYLDGEDKDPESGVSHIAHIRACTAILLDAMENNKFIDDRPMSGNSPHLIQVFTRKPSEE